MAAQTTDKRTDIERLLEFGDFTPAPRESWTDKVHIGRIPPRYGVTYRLGVCQSCHGLARIIVEPHAEIECLGACRDNL